MTTNQLKKKSFNTKKLIHWLHLWPGLISSIIVFFVCLTGVVIVYADEIIDLSAGKARYVEAVLPKKLPSETLLANAIGAVPGAKQSSYMVAYRDVKRSVRFNVFSKQAGLNMVYVDQYTGKVLKVDKTIFFFFTVAHLHESLMLDKPGQWIVDIATLIFFIEVITGIILWLPKNWNAKVRKSVFTVKWNSPWKRLSFDLHRVLGIYAAGILLVIIVTGLLVAFEPLKDATSKLFGGESAAMWQKSVSKTFDPAAAKVSIDSAVEKAFNAYPDKKEVKIALWKYKESPYFLLAATNRAALKSDENAQIMYVARTTGLVNENVPAEIIKGETFENVMWMLHMGNWLGPIGKLLTFLAGLIGCSLPITGFYIWWNKRPRKKKA